MKPMAEQVASDWIAFARYSPNIAPDEVFARGWALYDMAEDEPMLAWDAIKAVVNSYSKEDLFSEENPGARQVVGDMAAGPLECHLEHHGPLFIESVEDEARRDRRIAWALGGVWQGSMSGDIWARVRGAAGDIPYWQTGVDRSANMKLETQYDKLLHEVCVRYGWCGGPMHVREFIPDIGYVTADQFVDWLFAAEDVDPTAERWQRHKAELRRAFIQIMGSDAVDALQLK